MRNEKTLIIAEAGVNHNGSLERALQLIEAASEAGADVVKFQTFKAEKLVSPEAPKAAYQKETTENTESQYEMLRRLELPRKDYAMLMQACSQKGVQFLSSPFDRESLDFLTDFLKLSTIKLGSGEITNGPLLLRASRKKVPLILSTGMSTLGEVEMALGCLAFGYLDIKEKPSREGFLQAYSTREGQEALHRHVTLLHCTTEYPAPMNDINLRAMVTMEKAFGLPVGYSDHTPGIAVPVAAVALGATVIEKHFTLDKNLPGPDHKASLDPQEFRSMVCAVRDVELALGTGIKSVGSDEVENRGVVRKSLGVSRDILSGETWEENDLVSLRPGTGVSPMGFWDFVGKKVSQKYQKGDFL